MISTSLSSRLHILSSVSSNLLVNPSVIFLHHILYFLTFFFNSLFDEALLVSPFSSPGCELPYDCFFGTLSGKLFISTSLKLISCNFIFLFHLGHIPLFSHLFNFLL